MPALCKIQVYACGKDDTSRSILKITDNSGGLFVVVLKC
jgi:hypothetical protein